MSLKMIGNLTTEVRPTKIWFFSIRLKKESATSPKEFNRNDQGSHSQTRLIRKGG